MDTRGSRSLRRGALAATAATATLTLAALGGLALIGSPTGASTGPAGTVAPAGSSSLVQGPERFAVAAPGLAALLSHAQQVEAAKAATMRHKGQCESKTDR